MKHLFLAALPLFISFEPILYAQPKGVEKDSPAKRLSIPDRIKSIRKRPQTTPSASPTARPPNRTAKPFTKKPTSTPPQKEPNGPSYANLSPTKKGKCRPLPPRARVSFDFKGDIKELVETVSKTTCKNFILTNKVRSQKFEIVSPTPITVEEAWRAFLSALQANDFSLVRAGRYYKIIQANDGTRSPVPVYNDGEDTPVYDRMITKVIKLKHASENKRRRKLPKHLQEQPRADPSLSSHQHDYHD